MRRFLAGYLRLRSPYNLVVDAACLVLAAVVMSYVYDWLTNDVTKGYVPLVENQRQETWLLFWTRVTGFLWYAFHYAGIAVFGVGCARIIAEGRDAGGGSVERDGR